MLTSQNHAASQKVKVVVASEGIPSTSATPAVLVVGGDAIVGQALELLLQSADYRVTFMSEPSLEESGLLDGVQLLLVAPGLSAKGREALLALVSSTSATARIAVLELVSNVQGAQQDGVGHLVPWPCQPEELKRRIKAALLLLDGSKTDQDDDVVVSQEDGQYSQTRQDEV